MADIRTLGGSTSGEIGARQHFVEMLRATPIPDNELLSNLGLYLNRQTLSRILFMHELYQRIVNVHGVVMEFGVRWGQNLALYSAFRGMYEPFNYNRKIVGFDTFSGFPTVSAQDGSRVAAGDYGVSENYREHLEQILKYHESESPIAHKQKFELVVGDACKTVGEYFAAHPETVVAFAYFDFDLYEPTRKCLEAVLERVTRGSILAFDELNCLEFPGETLAVMETLGLSRYAIRRSPLNPLCSYLVVD
ncbi:MAG: crotonobetainyl-CoA--carnitine CoA-transferase [Ignavibacteria bacterium]